MDPQTKTLIFWINDGGTFNKGWIKLDGIDFQASYDWDWGDIGAFNVGVVGTYYLHRKEQTAFGAPIQDDYHTDLNLGPGQRGLRCARASQLADCAIARVWDGPMVRGLSPPSWTIAGTTSISRIRRPTSTVISAPTRRAVSTRTATAAPTPAPSRTTRNIQPSYYTFDLSFGYNTLDMPANEYLRNIGVQVVVQNILDKHGSYQYRISYRRRLSLHLRSPVSSDRQADFAHRHEAVVTRPLPDGRRDCTANGCYLE